MELVADLHVHTVSSGHAFSTVRENAQVAAEKGLELIAITDHGPDMPAAPHPYFFSNIRVLPSNIAGVEVLKGVEANIIDDEGNIDLSPRFTKYLDIILAGFHQDCYPPGSMEQNTRAMINAMASGRVDIIVHPGNPAFSIDNQRVAEAAQQFNVLLELNNTSLTGMGRKGSRDNCLDLAQRIANLGGRVSLGSDAHYAELVGDLEQSLQLARQVGLKEQQIINTSRRSIQQFLSQRGRPGRNSSTVPEV